MPSTGSAAASNASASPSRRSTASAPGLIVSPHSLSRGKRARSSISTRAPPRASTVAATDPAGPAPQTITSYISHSKSDAASCPIGARGSRGDKEKRENPGAIDQKPSASAIAPLITLVNTNVSCDLLFLTPHEQPESCKFAPTAPSTRAEFFEPNPRQLHKAAAGDAARPLLAM